MTICFYFHRKDFLDSFLSIINELSKKNKIFIIINFKINRKKKILLSKKNIFLYEHQYLIEKKILNLLNVFKIFSKNRNLFQIFVSFFYYYFKFNSEIKFIDSFFEKHKFDKLCVGSDREIGLGAHLIKKSKLNKRKVILLNVFSSNTSGSIVNRMRSAENICSKYNLKKLFFKKKHLLKFKGTTYNFFKSDLYFAAYFNNALVSNPWDRCYDADKIIVESKIAKQQLVKVNKISGSKIIVKGIPIFDLLKKRKNLTNKMKIILHMPHLYEHGFLSYPKTIKFYFSLLNKFIKLKINKKILIVYHPRVSKKIRTLILNKYKAFYCFNSYNLIRNLNNAQAFISWWSTTIGWALFMKIPTISLNCFGSPINGWEEFKKNTYVANNIDDINHALIKKVLKKKSIKFEKKKFNYTKIISDTILKV